MDHQQIERVTEKIQKRGIRLELPLGECELQKFEQAHGISLPESYRIFLLKVGNGGGGPPCYGLTRLGEAAEDMQNAERENYIRLPFVSKSFPFTKPWIWEEGADSSEGLASEVQFGNIFLGNDGCGQYWHLVVSGNQRGMMWQFCSEGIVPTEPNMDFLTWYECWLDNPSINYFE